MTSPLCILLYHLNCYYTAELVSAEKRSFLIGSPTKRSAHEKISLKRENSFV